MKIPFLLVLAMAFMQACSKDSHTSTLAHESPCLVASALVDASLPSHDFVFPHGLSQYTSGSRVLQTKTGRVYRCKGFPYTVYCREYSESSKRFEPGVGSNWMAAWDLN